MRSFVYYPDVEESAREELVIHHELGRDVVVSVYNARGQTVEAALIHETDNLLRVRPGAWEIDEEGVTWTRYEGPRIIAVTMMCV